MVIYLPKGERHQKVSIDSNYEVDKASELHPYSQKMNQTGLQVHGLPDTSRRKGAKDCQSMVAFLRMNASQKEAVAMNEGQGGLLAAAFKVIPVGSIQRRPHHNVFTTTVLTTSVLTIGCGSGATWILVGKVKGTFTRWRWWSKRPESRREIKTMVKTTVAVVGA
nr:hypothetical protein [Tanacetum cinerariifolium]